MFHHHGHAAGPPVQSPQSSPQGVLESLEQCITTARADAGHTDGPLSLRAGERRYFTLEGADLVEPKRGPSRRVGAYAGPSVKVTRGVYLHAGGYSGKTIPGEVKPTVIDSGIAVVTDQRVAFLGKQVTREFVWSKTLAYEHDGATRTTSFHVSNRQVVDAIAWGNQPAFAFFCDLAHAHFSGTVDQLIDEFEAQVRQHQPPPPGAPPPSSPPGPSAPPPPGPSPARSPQGPSRPGAA